MDANLSKLEKAESPPSLLDSIDLDYRGIKVHVYGILHGITGGTNQEYVDFVNATISQSSGYRFGEKGMLKLYKELHVDLEDWLPVSLKDMFLLAFSITNTPYRFGKFLKTILVEKFTKKDRFATSKTLQDIGGSPYFHLLDPSLRRELAGFPSSPHYLDINIKRRHGKNLLAPIVFPDRDWEWLTWIEPFANIPVRSIHMIEFATERAILNDYSEISLFVGELHNSDIEYWVCNQDAILRQHAELQNIVYKARELASFGSAITLVKRLPSLLSVICGMTAGLAPQSLVVTCLFYFVNV